MSYFLGGKLKLKLSRLIFLGKKNKMLHVAVVINTLKVNEILTTSIAHLEISCESSAWQTIHWKSQDFFL